MNFKRPSVRRRPTFLHKTLSRLIVFFLFLQLSSVTSYAQYTKLFDFGNTIGGFHPYSSLISDGTFLYGTTAEGGLNGVGTIYKIRPDGTGFTKLLDFDGDNGGNPIGSLFFDGTFLYGTASRGGTDGHGTIFKIMPDGTNFSKLFDFVYTTSGAFPVGAFVSDGTFLYGTTNQGGANGGGTIFKILPDGTGFVTLFDFVDATTGVNPTGTLYTDGTFLYGMTNGNAGTIFKIKTDGTGFSMLLQFTTADNGLRPYGSLISDGTFLYGMTSSIGDFSHYGRVFKIKPDGTGYASVLDFNNSSPGANPKGSLVYDGTFLYGMTTDYGANTQGTIFKVKPDGTGFAKLLDNDLYTFNPNPEGTLYFDGTSLYGVKSGIFPSSGGLGYLGAIFKINTNGSGYTKLHTFEVTGNSPTGSLTLNATTLTGTTNSGGLSNYGTIFNIKSDGTGLSNLYDFTGTSDGKNPVGRLIFDGTYFYGMTQSGGANGYGTVYKILPNGTGYTKLLDFDYTNNGNEPNGSLIYDGTTFLYGMTSHGGANSDGTIFKIKTNGSGYIKLHDFDESNGGYPNGSLISDGTFLYGITSSGGPNGWGTLFKIKLDGSNFTTLLDFDYANLGATPNGSLIYDGTFLFGMTSTGGANDDGTIFKVKTDGSSFTKLLDFDGTNNGASPEGSLLSDGTYLYGMTTGGGLNNTGTTFRIKPDGTGYAKFLDFNDGSNPEASLISDGTYLYGMTQSGGANGLGTLFKTTMTPFTSISNFSPSFGVVGTYITINGTNFDPTPANNIVTFNNTNAVVKSSTATTLTVLVPNGATTGPISVTANGTTGASTDFAVTASTTLNNGTIQSCNVEIFVSGYQYGSETFVPVNPSDKLKVSFSSFSVPDDQLLVYDGPTNSSPLIITLNGTDLPADIVATGSGGELTFEFIWTDGRPDTVQAIISCVSNGSTISITSQSSDFTACAGDIATFSTTASGTTNISYQWQYSVDGIVPFADLVNGTNYSNATTSILSVNTTGTFGAGRYRCKIDGDLATTVFTNDEELFINVSPAAPTLQGASACPSASLILNASGGTNGNYLWYTVESGGTAIAGEVNSSYTPPLLSATTTYYVSITDGTCESPRSAVVATINVCNPPTIATQPLTTQIGGIITIDLKSVITSDNLDLSSLQIITFPSNAASASIDANGILTINYTGKSFAGTDKITIRACDVNGQCSTQDFTINVNGDIIVFNAVSPLGANPTFFIQYIDVLPDTKNNSVHIFDRWENQVWHGSNYDNSTVVFSGVSDGGGDLPTGVYFYKIDFVSGKKTKTGFISLRRQ